jgi:hypothetical protein
LIAVKMAFTSIQPGTYFWSANDYQRQFFLTLFLNLEKNVQLFKTLLCNFVKLLYLFIIFLQI